jgi:Beta-lactamase
MAADTICRIASTTKPIVAACAMTLVEPPVGIEPTTYSLRVNRSAD